jgi:plastocyanin
MFKYIIFIVVLAVVGVGGYLFWMQEESEPMPQQIEQETEVEAPQNQVNTLPPGAVFEDGTIDEPVGDNEYHALISYTDRGYAPTTVTIKRGETVRFVNNASEGSWPASAVHPTHSIYPEKNDSDCLGSSFDACRELEPGEFWEFTFEESGSWRFHDHVHPSKTGVVNVE